MRRWSKLLLIAITTLGILVPTGSASALKLFTLYDHAGTPRAACSVPDDFIEIVTYQAQIEWLPIAKLEKPPCTSKSGDVYIIACVSEITKICYSLVVYLEDETFTILAVAKAPPTGGGKVYWITSAGPVLVDKETFAINIEKFFAPAI